MAQMCPAKSTIVPFKKQMYSSGSIILSYKDDKCICVSIHAPTRGATKDVSEVMNLLMFQSTHPRGVRLISTAHVTITAVFQSTHPRGVRQAEHTTNGRQYGFNPRTHEGCDFSAIA